MLRIAVPNKGSLAEPASQMLTEAGYRQRSDSRELVVHDPENDTEFFFLRPRDIAVYVGAGQLDVGITGEDLLLDSGAKADPILPLGFGGSTFRWAAMPGAVASVDDLAGKRIATAYEGVVTSYLTGRGIAAEVIRLDGAVETSVKLGVADAIADVVSTGTTLRNAGLEVFGEPLLTSEAVLIRRQDVETSGAAVDQLVRRLHGVIIARQYVLMDYDIPEGLVPQAVAITPGIESPTVSPLHERGWCAVRSMVRRRETNAIMDQLWDLGARGILVTAINACRL
ncbi:ATP phosphoribosyltransferase (homohexameric) [Jatrophihabitans endophyticus]|uniref:ATP phosphoribosyltransferase n=1 Tax=Jatrophihabitans endophyticus TaxID=1206085 RepID=A0A1M5LU04_9ACTN|nr:ATP phosphoribosyltransferase [Jatrophihabitans endophyticus]SHG68538.1 ATP phosphoribosyltransferase (homohexameric) [Jatrophihabitans endophyticus]